jgi:hypothetical protein
MAAEPRRRDGVDVATGPGDDGFREIRQADAARGVSGEMECVVPWAELTAVVESQEPK